MILGTRFVKGYTVSIMQTGIDKINENVTVWIDCDSTAAKDPFFIIKANTPDDQLPALVEVFLTAKAAQDVADAQLNGYAALN